MRGVLLVAACVSVVAIGPANAQMSYEGRGGCTKSIFWPFVRSTGDCLTDAEKRNGQTGVYGDPNAVLAPQPSGTSSGGFLGIGGSRTATTATRGLLEDSIVPAPVTAVAGTAPAANAPVVAAGPAPRAGALITRTEGVACTKGWFWPFYRSDGDCLTDAEKRNGQTGVYGNPNAAPATVVAAAPPQTVASLSVPPAPAAPAAAAPAAPASAAPPPGTLISRSDAAVTCTKGWFWPFHRNPGDCLTDVEKRNGQTGVFGNPNAVVAAPQRAAPPAAAPAVVASVATPTPSVAPATAPAPVQPSPPALAVTAANCNKGWFWPFYRSPGDCLTDVERRNGQTGVYGNPNAVAAAPQPVPQPSAPPVVASVASPAPVAAPPAPVVAPAPAPSPAPAVTAAAPIPDAANCTKGWFWPFYRSPGDCLTDVEKRNGQTGVYGNPNAPAVAAAPVGRPTATPASVASAPAPAAAPAPVVAPAPAPSPAPAVTAAAPIPDAANCTKGWFWPFYRSPGDCLTDVEKRNGQTGVYGNPNAPAVAAAPVARPAATPASVASAPAPAVAPAPVVAPAPAPSPVPAVTAAAPIPDAANCTKGWFWPFRRSPGDCLTDAEKRNGQTGVYGYADARGAAPQAERVSATPAAVVAPPAAAPAAPAAAPAAAAPTPASAAPVPSAETGCTKGWLWPFVRKAGDCPTDIERQNAGRAP